MPLFQLILVAVIQGLTEFLPVSSSGHLVLLPHLTGYEDQGLVIDVAVHVGTLFAVILYFWSDVRVALIGTGRLICGRVDTQGAFLALCLAIATIPVVAFGLILHIAGLVEAMRSVAVIGWSILLFGLVLYWADQKGPETKTASQWSLKDAAIMGLWQAIALIPGTSRSGIAITGARHLGYARRDAARLAMLMSIPVIAASGLVLGIDVASTGTPGLVRDAVLAATMAFVAAILALSFMMRLLRTVNFTPYAIYRVILGVILLIYAYN